MGIGESYVIDSEVDLPTIYIPLTNPPFYPDAPQLEEVSFTTFDNVDTFIINITRPDGEVIRFHPNPAFITIENKVCCCYYLFCYATSHGLVINLLKCASSAYTLASF